MTKIEMHNAICEDLHRTYKQKNSDYGGAYTALRKKHPNLILIHLHEKLSRLETLLSGKDPQVKNESINDTLADLANYAIMELVERTSDTEATRKPEATAKPQPKPAAKPSEKAVKKSADVRCEQPDAETANQLIELLEDFFSDNDTDEISDTTEHADQEAASAIAALCMILNAFCDAAEAALN